MDKLKLYNAVKALEEVPEDIPEPPILDEVVSIKPGLAHRPKAGHAPSPFETIMFKGVPFDPEEVRNMNRLHLLMKDPVRFEVARDMVVKLKKLFPDFGITVTEETIQSALGR